MPLTMKELLQFPVMNQATLITGEDGLENIVDGAMVMEALDIEEWGRTGQVLMTSYFAFQDVPDSILQAFFKNAKKIGIAGLVFKTDRLVNEIPTAFVNYCTRYKLPLIQISKDITYEKIINVVLVSVNNHHAFLLQNYYDNHQYFIQLMMSQPEHEEILKTLKKFIHVPISLVEKSSGNIIGTDEFYCSYELIGETSPKKQKHISLIYQYDQVTYVYDSNKVVHNLISFPIPNLGYEEYELLIHEIGQPLTDVDFMAVGNAVVSIQTELVKRFALWQNNQSRQNEMVSDLVHGRLTNKDDIEETFNVLKLDKNKKYLVIIFNIDMPEKHPSPTVVSRFKDTLVNLSKIEFPEVVYISRQQKTILLIPTDKLSIVQLTRKTESIMGILSTNKLYEDFVTHATLSNSVDLYDLPEAYRQAIDTYKIVQLMDAQPNIVFYRDIGIYQLFVETDNLSSLERFIPDKILQLKDENLILLETLFTFLNVHQNYSDTAQILFVHPKTIRYRIDRLKENYGLDFNNPEELLHYSIGIRLLKILSKQKAR